MLSRLAPMTEGCSLLPYLLALAIAYGLAIPIGWNREKEERSAGISCRRRAKKASSSGAACPIFSTKLSSHTSFSSSVRSVVCMSPASAAVVRALSKLPDFSIARPMRAQCAIWAAGDRSYSGCHRQAPAIDAERPSNPFAGSFPSKQSRAA
jgi:hypothetical protein